MPNHPHSPKWVTESLHAGIVIPAHPLALTSQRKFDEKRQRALTRYYHAAGSGGVAVGVHTTQFEIRLPEHGLLRPVLELAAATLAKLDSTTGRRTVRIAGICGATEQAVSEAELARELGYHVGLLSLGALRDAPDSALITHCRTVAEHIPIMGFYLQPAVGGRLLSVSFWREFAAIPNVTAIKIAPFNRYQTLDVIRAVAEIGRANDIALYTGNDDSIVLDLLTAYTVRSSGTPVTLRMAGGLLGHWACWTKHAVTVLNRCKNARDQNEIPADYLTLATQVTDCNAAFFDVAHQFAGCIPGIHEVLRRQGLLENTFCLKHGESLSPGQSEEILRVCETYPEFNDDKFIAAHIDEWMAD